MKVLISGSHGLIGRALVPALESAGHNVTRLVRHDASQTPRSAPAPSGPVISWDPFTRQVEEGEGDLSGLDGFDAVIHLAGAGIGDRRWNQAHKGVVRDSRLGPTKALAEALARCPRPPSVFVCASAIGYYGPGSAGAHAGEATLTEDSPPGLGFLARLCLDWEQACSALAQAGTRVVNARTGIVQATTGGVLARQLPLFRLGLGARLGSGQQWVSWITLDD
ncbi:MAG: epimerase, partial [Acidimicrobiales bacterium]